MSIDPPASKISIENLGPEHSRIFQRVFNALISTTVAELTFSQIIDGLPLADVWRTHGNQRRDDIRNHVALCAETTETWNAFKVNFQSYMHHVTLCAETTETCNAFKVNFQSYMFQFDSRLVQGYQNSVLGTKEFNVRLLEMVAVGSHELAALLYKNFEGGVGTHGPKPPPLIIQGVPTTLPTEFYHGSYMDYEQYPQGVADIVGYWAEYMLFGGVVVFDRGESETECLNAFVHPGHRFMIFQLSDTQLQAFADLGSAIPGQSLDESSLPFPFKAERYARRVDETESMALHIYRDKYERKPPVYQAQAGHRRWLADDPVTMDLIDKMAANNWEWPS